MDSRNLSTSDDGRAAVALSELVAPFRSPIASPLAVIPTAGRSRLARDLHDSVGQALFAMLVEIRVALDRGEAGRDDLLILEREAQNALQSVRALAYRIRRGTAEDPLGGARQYGEQLLGGAGRVFRWIDTRANPQLAHRVARPLAWSIREAITNAVRHGAATAVEVRLAESGRRIRVTVRDDGAGFVPQPLEPTPDGRGLGLLGSTERMAEVGGVLTIRSHPGEGTVVSLDAPRYLRPAVSSPSPATAQLSLDCGEHREAAAAVAS